MFLLLLLLLLLRQLVNAGEDALMQQCIDILRAVKTRVPRAKGRQIKYAIRLLAAKRDSGMNSVRKVGVRRRAGWPLCVWLHSLCTWLRGVCGCVCAQNLSTATQDGSIDKTTMNWVESTLQLNKSAVLNHPPTPHLGTPLGKKLSSRSSHADLVAALQDQRVGKLLGQVLTWEFNIFELVSRFQRRYLGLLASEIFNGLHLFNAYDVDPDVFMLFMDKLELTYCYVPDVLNEYHNAIHAADVLQAVAVFCREPRVGGCLEPLEVVALLFAAVTHDYRHPGVSNAFLMKTRSTLALRYNDDSVLENFHAASAFEVVSTPKYNIFKHLPKDTFDTLRKTVIRCILATDLAKGNDNIEEFTRKVLIPAQAVEAETSGEDEGTATPVLVEGAAHNTPESTMQSTIPALDGDAAVVLMQMVLKCADVSHPCRPMEQHLRWSNMVRARDGCVCVCGWVCAAGCVCVAVFV